MIAARALAAFPRVSRPGVSYLAISLTLAYLVWRGRGDIPFHWMVLAFGAFIIACGATHFMGVWNLWHPDYWLSGNVKLLTAVATVGTAIALPPLVPRVLATIHADRLAENRRVERLRPGRGPRAHLDRRLCHARREAR